MVNDLLNQGFKMYLHLKKWRNEKGFFFGYGISDRLFCPHCYITVENFIINVYKFFGNLHINSSMVMHLSPRIPDSDDLIQAVYLY